MKLSLPQFFSSIVSVIFHLCLIAAILFLIPVKTKPVQQKYVEIGFGGITESNSTGLPGEPQQQVKEKRTEIKKLSPKKIEKVRRKIKDVKKNPAYINNAAEKKDTVSYATAASDGSVSNGKPGGDSYSAASGSGGNGSAPAKKGITTNPAKYYVAVDQMPVPVGGTESINAKVYYPPAAKAAGVTGTVYVLAYIDENGNVNKTFLIKGIGSGCDLSAERAVRQTRFEPGRLNGVRVKVQMTIAVPFNNSTGQ